MSAGMGTVRELNYITKCPARCNNMQSIFYFYCKITLHVSGAIHTHHQEYVKL